MDKEEFAQRIFVELIGRTEAGTVSPTELAQRAIHMAEDFEAAWSSRNSPEREDRHF